MDPDDSLKIESVSCSWPTEANLTAFGNSIEIEQWPSKEVSNSFCGDNCVFFQKLTESVPCILDIKFNDPPCLIKKVCVISEARVVELYGKHGEYLGTSYALCMETCDGFTYYDCQPEVLTEQEISIKFLGLKRDEMCLFGIKIYYEMKVPHINGSNSIFNFNLIDEKLNSSKTQITEKAEEFKKFFQSYNNNKYKNKEMDSNLLLNIGQEFIIKSHKDDRKQNGDNLIYLMKKLLNKDDNLNNFDEINKQEEKKEQLDENHIITNEENKKYIKDCIEEGLKELEKKLQDNFEKKLEQIEAKQNEKLDSILSILKNVNPIQS